LTRCAVVNLAHRDRDYDAIAEVSSLHVLSVSVQPATETAG